MLLRGVSEAEVIETLSRGQDARAKLGRKARELTFDFGKEWNGRVYRHKRGRVVYVIEEVRAVVSTVFGYYGEWSD